MAGVQINLTEEEIHELLSGSDEGLKSLLQKTLNEVLDEQRTELIQAEPYERTDERNGERNGTYERDLTTRVGTIELSVPRIRGGEFSTELFERYQRSEKALVLALMEMVVNGVSMRRVKKITKKLCGESFSKSTVSRLCEQLDPIVEEWNERPLDEKSFPFLIVDGIVLKVREHGRVRRKSALVAVGINEDGYREILGLKMGDSENRESWKAFFDWLKDRGLHGVDVITSDAHRGLKDAAETSFQKALWQRCQFHFMRNILSECRSSQEDIIHERLKDVLEASTPALARTRLQRMLKEFGDKAPKAMTILEEGFEDATAVLHLPGKYRRRLRTTNMLERLNEEIRRRDKVIRIYPNERSAWRLVGALLTEQHEEWVTGRKYFDMTEYNEWKNQQEREDQVTREEAVAA